MSNQFYFEKNKVQQLNQILAFQDQKAGPICQYSD